MVHTKSPAMSASVVPGWTSRLHLTSIAISLASLEEATWTGPTAFQKTTQWQSLIFNLYFHRFSWCTAIKQSYLVEGLELYVSKGWIWLRFRDFVGHIEGDKWDLWRSSYFKYTVLWIMDKEARPSKAAWLYFLQVIPSDTLLSFIIWVFCSLFY